VAWFKPGGGNGSAGPVIAVGADYAGANNGFSFGIGGTSSTNNSYDLNGTYFTGLFAQQRWISTNVFVSTATWHMGAMVLDGNGYPSLYLDGTLVYTDFLGTASATALNPSGGSVYIGHDNTNGGNARWFNGYIADAAIFNTALTATQIANLYQTTSSIYGGSANFSSITANKITTFAQSLPINSNPSVPTGLALPTTPTYISYLFLPSAGNWLIMARTHFYYAGNYAVSTWIGPASANISTYAGEYSALSATGTNTSGNHASHNINTIIGLSSPGTVWLNASCNVNSGAIVISNQGASGSQGEVSITAVRL
jgi:hypothetical protein